MLVLDLRTLLNSYCSLISDCEQEKRIINRLHSTEYALVMHTLLINETLVLKIKLEQLLNLSILIKALLMTFSVFTTIQWTTILFIVNTPHISHYQVLQIRCKPFKLKKKQKQYFTVVQHSALWWNDLIAIRACRSSVVVKHCTLRPLAGSDTDTGRTYGSHFIISWRQTVA